MKLNETKKHRFYNIKSTYAERDGIVFELLNIRQRKDRGDTYMISVVVKNSTKNSAQIGNNQIDEKSTLAGEALIVVVGPTEDYPEYFL